MVVSRTPWKRCQRSRAPRIHRHSRCRCRRLWGWPTAVVVAPGCRSGWEEWARVRPMGADRVGTHCIGAPSVRKLAVHSLAVGADPLWQAQLKKPEHSSAVTSHIYLIFSVFACVCEARRRQWSKAPGLRERDAPLTELWLSGNAHVRAE